MTEDSFKDNPSQLEILWSNAIPLMTEKGYQEYIEIIKFSFSEVVKVQRLSTSPLFYIFIDIGFFERRDT